MKQQNRVFNSQVKALDESEQTLTALISTNAVDRMDERLDPKGVDLRHFKNNPVVLWAHDYEKQPVGKALWTKRQGDGIISKIKFAPTLLGQETFQLYKEGYLNAFSVGFIPKAHEDEDVKDQSFPRRTYTKWELLEFSAVPVPANPEALALAMQKGMVKSPEIIKAMEEGDSGTDIEEPEARSEDEGDEGKEKEEKAATGLEDLIADNDMLSQKAAKLQEELDDCRKELSEWQYKFYLATKNSQAKFSEIAEKDLAKKTADTIIGAIRKMSGKLD